MFATLGEVLLHWLIVQTLLTAACLAAFARTVQRMLAPATPVPEPIETLPLRSGEAPALSDADVRKIIWDGRVSL